MSPETITFSNGHQAPALCVHHRAELTEAFHALGIHVPCPTLVLVGGAAGLERHHEYGIQSVLRVAAETAESLGAALIDGGTQSGVIALMGKIYAEGKLSFPLLGVAVERMVRWPGNDNAVARAELDPYHTHFLLVPGNKWGDESAWLCESARALAQSHPSLTLLINGGEISRQDVNLSLQIGRPVLVAAGTGRLADELASAPSALMHVVAAHDAAALSSKLHALLTRS